MKAKLKAWRDRIDALALRERLLVLVAVLGALGWSWNSWLFAPLDDRRQALTTQVPKLHDQIQALNKQAGALALARTKDPDVANRRKLARLRAATTEVNAALAKLTSRLVPPREMGRLIEAVLARQQRLSLVRLEGLGAESIFTAKAAQAQPGKPAALAKKGVKKGRTTGKLALPSGRSAGPAGQTPGAVPGALYRHGLRATFEGGYLDILAYLRALEALPWRFLWDEVSLEVPRYPVARVTLTVYSLSLDDAWIGI